MENNALCRSTTDSSYTRQTLLKYAKTWERRAQVKKASLPNEIDYEIDKPDFLEELMPISECIAYQELDDKHKSKLLSYGWLAYNAKTIAIESKIIAPVCYDIMDGVVPGAEDHTSRELISETLTDEAYHILLCHHAMSLTERVRQIDRNILQDFDLIRKIKQLDHIYPESWQKILVRLAVAIVSEIFISDYLKCLSNSTKIVTFNRETTRSHRLDEISHGVVFTELTKLIYSKLTFVQKHFFASILHFPVYFFASKELGIWQIILNSVCPWLTQDFMDELSELHWFDLTALDYQSLITLANEIGIADFAAQLTEKMAILPLQNQL